MTAIDGGIVTAAEIDWVRARDAGSAADFLGDALPGNFNAIGDKAYPGDLLDLACRTAAVVNQDFLTEPYRSDILFAREFLSQGG